MKHLLVIIFATLTSFFYAQNKADDIIGTYMTDKNEAMIEVYKTGTKYFGKINWTKTPGKMDVNNPDAAQKTDKLAGKEMLKSLLRQ